MQKRGQILAFSYTKQFNAFVFVLFKTRSFLDVNFDGVFKYPIAMPCFLCLKEKNSLLLACIRRNLLFILTFLRACVNIYKY